MKFRLVEKAEYLHDPQDWDKIDQLEKICNVYYNWTVISPFKLNKIYDKHRGEIGRYYTEQALKQLDKEAAEWRAKNEDFENYNANPQDKNEGDCAVRSLALAYDLNYNNVRNELHSFGMQLKAQFNDIRAIRAFLDKHKFKNYFNNETNPENSIGTVADFAKHHKHGTFVLSCTNKPKQNAINKNHLVTILNGEIYDTWDSGNYFVTEAWEINNNANRLSNKISDKIKD